ncbi:MAG: hypothetical protein ABI603_01700 [Acidobacteriota bacterium]
MGHLLADGLARTKAVVGRLEEIDRTLKTRIARLADTARRLERT